MRTTLNNPYYFIKDNIIFNISDFNTQEDPCGKHYKTFDTETRNLKKGTYYTDKNGNWKITTQDGNVQVGLKTAAKQATITANKSVFPYFDVTYQYKDGKTETITYWLDDLITDGDKVSNGKFKNKTIHTKDTETTITYVDFYKKQCLMSMAENTIQGMTLDIIKANNPLLFIGSNVKINGSEATVTASGIAATEDEITNIFKEKIEKYGNDFLKTFNRTCTVNINVEQ